MPEMLKTKLIRLRQLIRHTAARRLDPDEYGEAMDLVDEIQIALAHGPTPPDEADDPGTDEEFRDAVMKAVEQQEDEEVPD